MKTKKQKIIAPLILFLLLCAIIFVGQYIYNQTKYPQGEGEQFLSGEVDESDYDEGEGR
jgi:hypothetical protein